MYFLIFILLIALVLWLVAIKFGAHKALKKATKNFKQDLYIDEEKSVDEK